MIIIVSLFLFLGLGLFFGGAAFAINWWQVRGGPIPEGHFGDAVAGDLLLPCALLAIAVGIILMGVSVWAFRELNRQRKDS